MEVTLREINDDKGCHIVPSPSRRGRERNDHCVTRRVRLGTGRRTVGVGTIGGKTTRTKGSVVPPLVTKRLNSNVAFGNLPNNFD